MLQTDKAENVAGVVRDVAEILGIKAEELTADSTAPEFKDAWRVAAYAAWTITGATTVEIGKAMGGVDHSRVILGRDNVKERMSQDPILRYGVSRLLEELRVMRF